jgi:hypothetical protein
MIRASVRASLSQFLYFDHVFSINILGKLRVKLQIPIPTTLGRAMFGVVDESGQLQYGQVFIRYTKNSSLKLPGPTVERQVLKGPINYSNTNGLRYDYRRSAFETYIFLNPSKKPRIQNIAFILSTEHGFYHISFL